MPGSSKPFDKNPTPTPVPSNNPALHVRRALSARPKNAML